MNENEEVAQPSECGNFHYGKPGEAVLHECKLAYDHDHDGEHSYSSKSEESRP